MCYHVKSYYIIFVLYVAQGFAAKVAHLSPARWHERSARRRRRRMCLGCGQMGSALMGSLQK